MRAYSEIKEGEQPFLYVSHPLDLILIHIKWHEISQMDIDLWGVKEVLEKQNKFVEFISPYEGLL